MERLYCPNCGGLNEIEVKPVEETYTVRGEEITILADVAHCQFCGEQIFYEALDSKNLDKVYAEFRKRRDILTPEQIRAIRDKYGLSQRSLGRLLRLGEVTIHRYENGSLPSDAHNELLVLIDNPSNVKALLAKVGSDLTPKEEENLRARLADLLVKNTKRRLIDSAEEVLSNYEPSLFSGFRKFNPDKIQEMAVLIANEATNLSKTKMMKLFFYSDFYHFKNNGVSISGLRYAHLPYGPMVNNYNTLFTWLEWQKAISFSLIDTRGLSGNQFHHRKSQGVF